MELYTKDEMFNLKNVFVTKNTIVDRFSCKLICSVNGVESAVAKRKWNTKDVNGQGYIGFDAYNHYVNQDISQRIRITYVGGDFVNFFVRTPAQGNVPEIIKVNVHEEKLLCQADCGNGVVYKLFAKVKTAKD